MSLPPLSSTIFFFFLLFGVSEPTSALLVVRDPSSFVWRAGRSMASSKWRPTQAHWCWIPTRNSEHVRHRRRSCRLHHRRGESLNHARRPRCLKGVAKSTSADYGDEGAESRGCRSPMIFIMLHELQSTIKDCVLQYFLNYFLNISLPQSISKKNIK